MGGFSTINRQLLYLFKIFFPPACPLCGVTFPTSFAGIFCRDCLAGFNPLPKAHCPQCSLPYSGSTNSSHLCGRCITQPPDYTQVYAVGLYESTLRRAIHQFKFNQKVGLDRFLGQLLEQNITTDLPLDVVVPVPLHHKRLRERSYNQALLLAREVARIRSLPVVDDMLHKESETASQHVLSARQRVSNLQDAFVVRGDVVAKTVLLVDDVMTTGATVAACSKVLKKAGAKAVYVAVIGRAA